MSKITGSCMCGQAKFEADGDIKMMANCHCDDCQRATGAAYATLVSMMSEDIQFTGEVGAYDHKSDAGNTLTKNFCKSCGSPMYGTNTARAGMHALRAGVINEKDLIKPGVNVFCSSAIPSTPRDESLKAFDKMPG
jgi:hypothetical protein